MLHEFITIQRDAIVARTREKLSSRSWPWPTASPGELTNGVPLFLTQLSDTLRLETTDTPFPPNAIGATASHHGRELLALGYDVSHVVHAYGDICQAVTEIAVEQQVPIATEEFHTLNRCLDIAIAEAVTEHTRGKAQSASTGEVERLGQLTHEMRNMVSTALLAFEFLKRGTVAINGATGAALGRSLVGLRDLVGSTMSDVRMAAAQDWREQVPVAAFLEAMAEAGRLQAEYSGVHFAVEPVAPGLALDADPQLLGSAVMNLLNNAFKYTPAGGHVVLRAHQDDQRVRIEVEDECGGLPDTHGDPFRPFGDRRGRDRTGLGLGLSIARKAIAAHGGVINIRNLPGKGCVFVIEVPLPQARSA